MNDVTLEIIKEKTYKDLIKSLHCNLEIDLQEPNIYNLYYNNNYNNISLIKYDKMCSDGFRGALDFIIVFNNTKDLNLFIKLMKIYDFIEYEYVIVNNKLAVNFKEVKHSIFAFRIARLFTYNNNDAFSSYVEEALKHENPHLYLMYLCWNTRYIRTHEHIYDKYDNYKYEDLKNNSKAKLVFNTPYIDMYPNGNFIIKINPLKFVKENINDSHSDLFYTYTRNINGGYLKHIFTKSVTFEEFLKIHNYEN